MMRFFSRQDPDHCETSELLPWFLNGTLDDGERRRVERHVAECVLCRREVARERDIRDAVATGAPDASWRPSFARVSARIDAMEKDSRKRTPWRAFADALAGMAPWLQGAVAVQAVLVCVLAVGWYRASEAPAYRTLAAPSSASTSETIIVVFDPTTSERDLRHVLLAEKARLVGGPSTGGAYTLEVRRADVDVVLARLRQSSLVRFAERGALSGMSP